MNALVLRSAIVAALGDLLFGYDTAVISGTTESLERLLKIMPETKGVPLEEMEKELGLIGSDAGELAPSSGPVGH